MPHWVQLFGSSDRFVQTPSQQSSSGAQAAHAPAPPPPSATPPLPPPPMAPVAPTPVDAGPAAPSPSAGLSERAPSIASEQPLIAAISATASSTKTACFRCTGAATSEVGRVGDLESLRLARLRAGSRGWFHGVTRTERTELRWLGRGLLGGRSRGRWRGLGRRRHGRARDDGCRRR